MSLNPRVKTILIPFLVVDAIFLAVLAFWLVHRRGNSPANTVVRIELRHLESKLTEIDLVNDGDSAGPIAISVDVSWPDADLVEARGLSQFIETDTGRRSLRFYLQPSVANVTVTPGQPDAIGWIKLTDDVPVHADIAANGPPATEP